MRAPETQDEDDDEDDRKGGKGNKRQEMKVLSPESSSPSLLRSSLDLSDKKCMSLKYELSAEQPRLLSRLD